jgi:hypothetical protein
MPRLCWAYQKQSLCGGLVMKAIDFGRYSPQREIVKVNSAKFVNLLAQALHLLQDQICVEFYMSPSYYSNYQ